MGYYTDFKLHGKEDEEFEHTLHEISTYEFWDYYDGAYQMNAKWYEYEGDMKSVSEHYPEHLFKLEGEGEESGDIWTAYYKNGKSVTYRPKIIMPEFNEKDLK